MAWAADFANCSTFHGPNHASETTSKIEKAFWLLLFVIGLGMAMTQGYLLVQGYFSDEGNMQQVVTTATYIDKRFQKTPITICRARWIDWSKAKKVPPDVLLFAFSLIPSLDKSVLDRINDMMQPSPEQKIWGLPVQECFNEEHRKKRFSSESTATIGENPPILNANDSRLVDTDDHPQKRDKRLIADVFNLATGIAGNLVGGAFSGIGDLAGLVANGGSELFKVLDGQTKGMLSQVGSITQGLIEEGFVWAGDRATEVAVEYIITLLRKRCSCQISTGTMKDWEKNADIFRGYMQKANFRTLTDFFASIARNSVEELFENPNSPEESQKLKTTFNTTGWRIFDGSLCQIVDVNLGEIEKNAPRGKRITTEIFIPLQPEKKIHEYAKHHAYYSSRVALFFSPFSAESSYEPNKEMEELPQLSIQNQKDRFGQIKVMHMITMGRVPAMSVVFKNLINHRVEQGCIPAPLNRRYPKDYGKWKCEKECQYDTERKEFENKYNCTFVSSSFVGEIPVNEKRICQNTLDKFKSTRKEHDITAEVDACIMQRKCYEEANTYCSEWSAELDVSDMQVEPTTSNGVCDVAKQLATIKINLEFSKISVITTVSKYSWIDILGIVGGIFGLFVGASILTFIHAIVFFVRYLCTLKTNEVEDENEKTVA